MPYRFNLDCDVDARNVAWFGIYIKVPREQNGLTYVTNGTAPLQEFLTEVDLLIAELQELKKRASKRDKK